jgi:hypothetical protein
MADKAVLRTVKSMNNSFDLERFVDAQSSEHRVRPIKVSNAALLRGSPRPIQLVRHPVARGATQSAPALSKMKLKQLHDPLFITICYEQVLVR